jgi:hypothetical protein
MVSTRIIAGTIFLLAVSSQAVAKNGITSAPPGSIGIITSETDTGGVEFNEDSDIAVTLPADGPSSSEGSSTGAMTFGEYGSEVDPACASILAYLASKLGDCEEPEWISPIGHDCISGIPPVPAQVRPKMTINQIARFQYIGC